MSAKKEFVRKCEICHRSTFDDRMLGPLVHTKTISAHFNCVLYSPVMPDAMSLAPRLEDDAVAGVSTRFVCEEGKRAKKLACNYCKTLGAHIGCCQDIGSDSVVKFCSKKYHVDCGLKAGASFNISRGRGAVSICYEHRDPIERADERHSMVMVDENINENIDEASDQEYDTGEDPLGNLFHLEGELENPPAENGHSLQKGEAVADQVDVYEQVEYLEIEQADGAGSTTSATLKEEEEPFNLVMMRTSLDNDTSNASDCIITAAYIVFDDDTNDS